MKGSKTRLLISASAVVLISFSSCIKTPSTSTDLLYVPTAADVTASASLSDLQNGRTLYIGNCGACHDLVIPETYTASQWRSILPNMTPRTSLTPAEVTLVTKYVTKGK